MRRGRKQIDAQFIHAHGQQPHGLHRITVQRHPSAVAHLGDGAHGRVGAQFIVRVHDRHQPGFLRDSFVHLLGRDGPVGSRPQIGDRRSLLFERFGRAQDGLVLGQRRDQVPTRPVQYAPERQVVGLGAAAGEDDLGRLGADQRGDALATLLDGHACPTAKLVYRRRVTVVLLQIRPHRLQHARIERRRGGMVQIDDLRLLHGAYFL